MFSMGLTPSITKKTKETKKLIKLGHLEVVGMKKKKQNNIQIWTDNFIMNLQSIFLEETFAVREKLL